jgi:hypothetical protein
MPAGRRGIVAPRDACAALYEQYRDDACASSATSTYDNTGDTALLAALHRGPGQVLEASKISIVQRAAPLRSILASLVISGTPRLSARAT